MSDNITPLQKWNNIMGATTENADPMFHVLHTTLLPIPYFYLAYICELFAYLLIS